MVSGIVRSVVVRASLMILGDLSPIKEQELRLPVVRSRICLSTEGNLSINSLKSKMVLAPARVSPSNQAEIQ